MEYYRGTDELIARFKATGKASNRALLREIALAKLYHIDFGEGRPDALIRFELMDMIASKLTTDAKWEKEQRDAKRQQADRRYATWQMMANQIWAANGKLSRRAVAQRIAKITGDNPDTIRKRIHKPKK